MAVHGGTWCTLYISPGTNGSIDIRYSANPLKAVSGLRLVPYSGHSLIPVALITEPRGFVTVYGSLKILPHIH